MSGKPLIALRNVSRPNATTIGARHTRHGRRYDPAVRAAKRRRKKLSAAFDGRRITSDGGVILLSLVERRIGIAEKLVAKIADPASGSRH